jgi:FkbM family methyltransferase
MRGSAALLAWLASGAHAVAVDCAEPAAAAHPTCHDPMMAAALALAANRSLPGAVLDVGANGGAQSWTALRAGRDVYAVECLASAYAALLAMFRRQPRVAVVHACASNETALAALHLAHDSSSLRWASTVASQGERKKAASAQRQASRATEPAVALPLDALFGGLAVALVKLDTQGSEHAAMLGMRRLLAAQTPVVMYEYDKRFGTGGALALSDVLAPLGYRCHKGRGAGKHDLICAVRLRADDVQW